MATRPRHWRARRAADQWPGNDEVVAARAELAYLTGAADGDALATDLAGRMPDMTGFLVGLGARVRHSYFLKQRGNSQWVQEADEVLQQQRALLVAGGDGAFRHLDIAAALMVKDDRDAALQSLAEAFKSGYREYALLEADPIFAPVRSDARFTAIMASMKSDVERQRRRAAERSLLDLESLAPGIR